jgi:hypothetical protein
MNASHYRSNLRDLAFNLFEVFDTGALLGNAPFTELDGQAEVALGALDAGAHGADAEFYTGKTAAARFFASTVLPELAARRTILAHTDNTLMDVPDGAF